MPLDVDATTVRGKWLKHVVAGQAPLPSRPDPRPDNRWQHGYVVDAIYLAEDEQTVWAEWYRFLAEVGLPPNQSMPRDLWSWDVDLTLADLSDETRLARVSLPLPVPGRSTWSPFQSVGEMLWREGWAGLVAPSAARPAGFCLCLFWDGSSSLPGAVPGAKPRRITQPPAPPRGMVT